MMTPTCPQCHDEVSLPLGAGPRATVRCPLCREEFALREVLNTLPPLLEVVEDPEGDVHDPTGDVAGLGPSRRGDFAYLNNAIDSRSGYEVVDDGVSNKRSKKSGSASATPFSLSAEPFETEFLEEAPPPQPRRFRPNSTSSHNVIGEMFKIVVGGIVGLGIGYWILMWVGRQDPLDLGAKVGQVPYLKYTVPQEYRGFAADEGNDVDSQNTGSENDGASKPSPATIPGQENESGPPQNEGETGVNSETSGESDSVDKEDLFPAQAQPDVPSPLTSLHRQRTTSMSLANRIVTASVALGSGFDEALRHARRDNKNWDERPDDDNLKRLAMQLYESLTRLSEIASLLSAEDLKTDDREAKMASFLAELTSDRGKLDLLGSGANYWMDPRRRHTNYGAILVGRAVAVRTKGKMFETVIQLRHKDRRQVNVWSYHDSRKVGRVGQSLLVVGCFVNDPAEFLQDFSGNEKSVIVASRFTLLPEEDKEARRKSPPRTAARED